MREKPDCEICKRLREERNKREDKDEEPDCFHCMETHGMSMPSLLESNVASAKIYSLSYAQVIVAGMGGIIDLNHLALWKNIEQFKEEYEIDDINECFLRVVNLSRVFIEEDNRKASEEMRRSSKR